MITAFRKLTPLLLLLLASRSMRGQDTPLDRYVREGLEKNIVLQQKNIALERAMEALNQAKSLYLPNFDLQAGYQTGEGGRSISLPVGDLLNPVYSTLNQLTASNRFPQINNVNAFFLPNNLTDVKVATSFPIINKNIGYNKRIQQQQIELKKTDLDAYRRELVSNIKAAYFNYLTAAKAIRIYESAAALAAEGKRTNERLLNNGKGLPAYVLRSESEVVKVQAALSDAIRQADNARLYFNFLINAEPTQRIDTTYNTSAALENSLNIAAPDASRREELKMLQQAVDINKTALAMNKDYYVPKLNGFFNAGNQAERFNYTQKSWYYFGGVQLEVPIFHGRSNRIKIRQAALDVQEASLNLKNVEKQLTMAATIAKNNLQQSINNYNAALTQAEAAASYQRLIEKGYKEGVNSFIETIDARNQLTSAELQVNINKYRVLAAAAALERETASFQLP